jgi:hypothetical protein
LTISLSNWTLPWGTVQAEVALVGRSVHSAGALGVVAAGATAVVAGAASWAKAAAGTNNAVAARRNNLVIMSLTKG